MDIRSILEKGYIMKNYVKIPPVNTGHLPTVEESEEYDKALPEKQKKV